MDEYKQDVFYFISTFEFEKKRSYVTLDLKTVRVNFFKLTIIGRDTTI